MLVDGLHGFWCGDFVGQELMVWTLVLLRFVVNRVVGSLLGSFAGYIVILVDSFAWFMHGYTLRLVV